MPRRVEDPSYWHPVTVPWFNINCTKRLPLIGKYEILRSRTSAPFGHRLALEGAFSLAFWQDAGHIDIPRAPTPCSSVRLRKMLSGKKRGCSVLWELRRLCRMRFPSPTVWILSVCAYLPERDPRDCLHPVGQPSEKNSTAEMRLRLRNVRRVRIRINSYE